MWWNAHWIFCLSVFWIADLEQNSRNYLAKAHLIPFIRYNDKKKKQQKKLNWFLIILSDFFPLVIIVSSLCYYLRKNVQEINFLQHHVLHAALEKYFCKSMRLFVGNSSKKLISYSICREYIATLRYWTQNQVFILPIKNEYFSQHCGNCLLISNAWGVFQYNCNLIVTSIFCNKFHFMNHKYWVPHK